MYSLTKTKQVEASHFLPNHDGKCRGLHGHTWRVSVTVEGEQLHGGGPKKGMLFDYYDIGQLMKEHVEVLDHRHLNDIFPNPTSENIARSLYGAMAPKVAELSKGFARLARVEVSETQNSVASYSEAK
jgi:6-pyruvoyltetrahydropterin/6-carboxytetrahydropterin synthase